MFLAFVDEAGTPFFDKPTGRVGHSEHLTLACWIMHGDDVVEMEKAVNQCKTDHGIPDRFEFKWNSSYSKAGLTLEKYKSYRTRMIELINEYGVTLIAAVMHKREAMRKRYINTPEDLYYQAFFLILERVHKFITGDPGVPSEPCLFIVDSRNEKDNARLNKAYRRALRYGTEYVAKFVWFSETLLFVSSESSPGVQLSDYCAGPIQQFFETDNNEWFKHFEPVFRRSPSGQIVGWGLKRFP